MGRSPRSTAAIAVTPLASTSSPTHTSTSTPTRAHSPHQTRNSTRTANARIAKAFAQAQHTESPGPESTPSPPEEHISTPPATVVRSGIQVEPKSHALRSVGGERERSPCPFPDKWGGKERCGVAEDDERDETLMAVCSVIADSNNRAWSPDEIAQAAYAAGWMRPPTAAIEPAVIVNNCIRTHQKRCATAAPPRPMLLAKYQLAGSVNESVLESALHPNAFDEGARPKGTVWYLITVGKTKWKNPFDGLEVPRAPPRKPIQTKPKLKPLKPVPSSLEKKGKTKVSTPSSTPAPSVKIRLLVNPSMQPEDSESEVNTSNATRSPSLVRDTSRHGSSTPMAAAQPLPSRRSPRTMSNPLDSSDDDSDSDSDVDMDLDAPDSSRLVRPKFRKVPPAPINTSGSPRIGPPPLVHRPASSSSLMFDLFQPSGTPVLTSFPGYGLPVPHTSPFPSHSLDNTTWTARHEQDRFSHFETSSSSSDEDMRDQDWGTNSDILIRGEEGEGIDAEDDEAIWSAGDEEAKVKEATDALRVLFPMTSPDDDLESDPASVGIFGIHAAPSDTGSLAESSSTLTAKNAPLNSTVALSAYTASSPINSPNLRPFVQLAPETSPTQHLPSNLRNTFIDDQDMEEEEDTPAWLDESGELFVKAEDTLSEAESVSNIGDVPPLEHDRTAEWAKVIAENTLIKAEPEDYPSPLTTESEERLSRASSESRTPSSRSSELPPFEMDADPPEIVNADETMVGPESVSVEELDVWLPNGRPDRTPQKSKRGRHPRGSHSGPIGVAALCSAFPLLVRNRSTRSSRTARRARPTSPSAMRPAGADYPSPTPSAEDDSERMDDDDAIGTEDLERACREAEAREEQCRKRCRERAEQQRLLFEAYRQKVKESSSSAAQTPADMCDPRSPWSDVGFVSVESLHLQTPTAVSPPMLQSIGNMTLSDPAYPTSMDPRDLLSPPIMPLSAPQGVFSFEEAFIQSEVDALVAKNLPIPPLPELLPAAAVQLPTLAPRPPVEQGVHVKTEKPATASASSSLSPVSLADTAQRPLSSSAVSASSASSGSTSTTAPQTKGVGAGPAPQPRKQVNQTTKRLMPGIDACVIDNIPVYAHETVNKIKILRRLDSDFVNATSLLLALGVPPAKHGEYVNGPSPQYHTHRTVPESLDGNHFSPGVPGIWVQHCEALEYVKKLDPRGPQAWNILREDLFLLFATLAGIEPQHSASSNFGAFFIPTLSGNKPSPPASSNLAVSSVNSKSAPNLTVLSTSAPTKGQGPLRPSASHPKGPLIRSAPATPPDGAPQPKRRRATVVGSEPSPLAKLAPGPKKAGFGAGPATAPLPIAPLTKATASPNTNGTAATAPKRTVTAKRSTRASVGGDVAKPSPKVVTRADKVSFPAS